MPKNHKNAARDMRNSWKSFVFFWDFSKFAIANFGEEGVKSLGSILHDRLTSFDLAKSGKFTSGVKTSLVKLVLYLLRRARTAYYICDTRCSRTLPVRCREVGRVLLLVRKKLSITNMLTSPVVTSRLRHKK